MVSQFKHNEKERIDGDEGKQLKERIPLEKDLDNFKLQVRHQSRSSTFPRDHTPSTASAGVGANPGYETGALYQYAMSNSST